MDTDPARQEFVGEVLAGPVLDFMNYRDVVASECLNEAACHALTVQEGAMRKLCVRHLDIDQSPHDYEDGGPEPNFDDGAEVLRHIYIPALRAISLKGLRADLFPLLNFAAGLATSHDWHVTDVEVWEDELIEEQDDEVVGDFWSKALRDFVSTLVDSELPSKLLSFRLLHSSPLEDQTLNSFTAALARSPLLRCAELSFPDAHEFELPLGWARTDSGIVFHREMATLAEPLGPPSACAGGIRVPYRRIPDLRPRPVDRKDKVTGKLVAAPSVIVISHTAYTEDSAIDQFRRTGIAQHFMVTERGELLQFVDMENRAWHAGVSFWGPLGPPGLPPDGEANDVNSHSIGVTLVGNGIREPFKPAQYTTLCALLSEIKRRYGITGDNVVGLGEVAYPPGRHDAPGRFFDWDALENYDRAILSRRCMAERRRELPPSDGDPEDWPRLLALLRACGYGVGDSKVHVVARIKQMADRYLGPSMFHTPKDVFECAQVLASWRRDLERAHPQA